MQLLPGGTPSSCPGKSGCRKTVSVPGLRDLLHIDQLIRWTELSRSNDILDLGHDHGNDRERLADACGLGNHALFHHLRLDLAKAGNQGATSGLFGDQDAGGPYHCVDDVAGPKRELLDSSRDARPNQGLVQLDLRLRQRRFCTGFLGRQQR